MKQTYETGRVLKEYVCLVCGHQWFQRKPEELPRQCPHCKSARWNIGRLRPRKSNE